MRVTQIAVANQQFGTLIFELPCDYTQMHDCAEFAQVMTHTERAWDAIN